MEKIDISSLTLEQMIELQSQLVATLPDKKKQRLSQLQDSIREQIEKSGLTAEEVLRPLLPNKSPKKSSSGNRKPAVVKYRSGNDSWTGRGRVPGWLVKFEDEGGNRETLRV